MSIPAYKACASCKRVLSQELFYVKSGGEHLHPYCKECHKKRPRPTKNAAVKGRRRKKAEFVLLQKLGRPCAQCGLTFHPWQMDFDHVDGTKLESVSTLVNQDKSLRRISEEISKCQLVCVGCHRIRTFSNNQHMWPGIDTGQCVNPKFAGSPELNTEEPSKVCSVCHETRNLRHFPKSGRWYRNKCNVCTRVDGAKTREKYRRDYTLRCHDRRSRLRKTVNAHKDGPCADCGQKHDPYLMDFDHVGGKTGNVSSAILQEWEESRLLAEIGKCELVCCWCHRTRTYRRLVASGKAYDFGLSCGSRIWTSCGSRPGSPPMSKNR